MKYPLTNRITTFTGLKERIMKIQKKIMSLFTIMYISMAFANTHASDIQQGAEPKFSALRQAHGASTEKILNEKLERQTWFNDLQEEHLTILDSLYHQWYRGEFESPQHQELLAVCFLTFYRSEKIHSYLFAENFCGILSHMPAVEACQFFDDIFTSTLGSQSMNSHKWFLVMHNFFCQLPEEDQNGEGFHKLLELFKITRSDEEPQLYKSRKYVHRLSKQEEKALLRKMRRAMSNQQPLTLNGLQVFLEEPSSHVDGLKEKGEEIIDGAKTAALIPLALASIGKDIITGQWMPH